MLHPVWLHHVDTGGAGKYPLRWFALAVICLAIFIGQIDMTIVNLALPSIATDLDATTSDLQWVMDAYAVTLAGFVLIGGGLADRFGRKGVFMLGVGIFGTASLAALVSTAPWQLIAARGVMGLGAALFFPPALSILAVIFAPGERGRAVAMWAAVAGISTALGPVVGGLLLERFWWGSTLLVNVPVAVLAIVGAALLIPTSRRPGAPSLDRVGAVLSVVGLGAFVFGVIEGPNEGWASPIIVSALALGVAATVAFIAWEARVDHPMVDVGVFRYGGVSAGGLALVANMLALSATLFLVPLYLQSVRGLSAITVGVLFLPFGTAFTVVALSASGASARYGVRRVLTIGLLIEAGGLMVLSIIGDVGGVVSIVIGLALFGVGAAIVAPPATTAVMDALPTAKAGDGSAVNQLTRQVGAALGVAVAGTVLASVYATALTPALSSLPPAEAAVADASINGAQQVAARLPSGSAALLDTADAAYVTGFRSAMLVPAGLAVLTAAAVMVLLRTPHPTTPSTEPTGHHDAGTA